MSKKFEIIEKSQSPWYKEGLQFECTSCGKCCSGFPGYVWLSEEEIQQICEYLKLSQEEFLRKYTRLVGEKISLIETNENYSCIFLRDKKCSIYPVRPTQCQTFPWWPQNLVSKQHWENASKFCEGINHENASFIPLETIQKQLQKQVGQTN